MSKPRGFKQKLSKVSRLWESKDYDTALAEVESMLKMWPGNPHLHILWASLVQLQEDPKHELEEAKRALQEAVELDKGSAAAAIELGHFLDNVEDDPQAAARAYAEGVAAAARLLLDGLIGQAKVLRQLGKREAFLHCLAEVLHLARLEKGPARTKAEESGADIIFESPSGHFHAVKLKGPHAEQIQDLLNEWIRNRSA
jgi:tetratricopeptide (TPR) repeat protein